MREASVVVNRELARALPAAVLLGGPGEGRELAIGLWGYFLFVSHPYGIKVKQNFIRWYIKLFFVCF